MTDEEMEEELEKLFRAEDYYYEVEMPKIRQKIAEFKAEMGNWGKCRRLVYVYDRLIELDLELRDRHRRYKMALEEDSTYLERALIASYIPDNEREIRKLEWEAETIVRVSKRAGISNEMIERARQYPFENLIKVCKGRSLCPFHDDHHPSMDVRKGFFYCYACGAKGDIIDFVMKRDGLTFIEAVKVLSSNN